MLTRFKRFIFGNRKADESTGAAWGKSLTALVNSANKWREQYNPLRSLTISRVVSLREAFLRGEMAEMQWTYCQAETSNPDLMALVNRRLGSIADLEWSICEVEKSKYGYDEKLAEDQANALRSAYEQIDNLNAAIEHLALASFRGYSHLEKILNGDKITHLEPANQWNVARDGWRGAWRFNPNGDCRGYQSLGAEMDMPPENWIIRECYRHIDWIGLALYVRQSLGQKDWDGFVEIYGVPGAVVVGPPNTPAGKESDYEDAAQAVAEGGSGYLPNGSSVYFPSEVRGQNPFRSYLDYQTEKLVLAGTGGLLTMLTAPTGIGKGPSEEHADVFRDIAIAEAKQISEVFQRQFDKEILEAAFPGKPILAYFRLASNAANSAETISFKRQLLQSLIPQASNLVINLTDMKALALDAGVPVNNEYSEPYMPVNSTGIPLKDKEGDVIGSEPKPNPAELMMKDKANGEDLSAEEIMKNRTQEPPTINIQSAAQAVALDLKPIADRLQSILEIADEEIFKAKLKAFRDDLGAFEADINKDPALAGVLAQSMAKALERAIK